MLEFTFFSQELQIKLKISFYNLCKEMKRNSKKFLNYVEVTKYFFELNLISVFLVVLIWWIHLLLIKMMIVEILKKINRSLSQNFWATIQLQCHLKYSINIFNNFNWVFGHIKCCICTMSRIYLSNVDYRFVLEV